MKFEIQDYGVSKYFWWDSTYIFHKVRITFSLHFICNSIKFKANHLILSFQYIFYDISAHVFVEFQNYWWIQFEFVLKKIWKLIYFYLISNQIFYEIPQIYFLYKISTNISQPPQQQNSPEKKSENEEKLDKKHQEEIENIDKKHHEEIENIDKKHQEEIENLEKKHHEEIENITKTFEKKIEEQSKAFEEKFNNFAAMLQSLMNQQTELKNENEKLKNENEKLKGDKKWFEINHNPFLITKSITNF